MTKDEALKLAFEALENHCGNYKLDDAGCKRWNKAVAAIKEALAQPEQDPVAWEQFYPDIGKPQLGQEPVAIYRAGQAKGEGFHVEFLKEMGGDETLLYTTPPQRPWVGLTAQEAADCWTTSATKTWHNFEAALRSKNT